MTVCLFQDTLNHAYTAQKSPKGLIHHSDRGSQYASAEYQEHLKTYRMIRSMSRKGNATTKPVSNPFKVFSNRSWSTGTSSNLGKKRTSNYIGILSSFKTKTERIASSAPDRIESQYFDNSKRAGYLIFVPLF
ncbi:Integrase core domain protein [compost metagenome]